MNNSLANGTCTGITADTTSFEYTARLYLLSGFERAGHIAEFRRRQHTGKVKCHALKFLIKHGTEWFACQKTTAGMCQLLANGFAARALGHHPAGSAGGDVFILKNLFCRPTRG